MVEWLDLLAPTWESLQEYREHSDGFLFIPVGSGLCLPFLDKSGIFG